MALRSLQADNRAQKAKANDKDNAQTRRSIWPVTFSREASALLGKRMREIFSSKIVKSIVTSNLLDGKLRCRHVKPCATLHRGDEFWDSGLK